MNAHLPVGSVIAALVPRPRTHRLRYFGVLAPNSPLPAGVTAVAQTVSLLSVQALQIRRVKMRPQSRS